VTITYPAPSGPSAVDGVYPPQQDSQLLVETMERTALVPGQRVLDLCTGSGFVAIAAAEMGAASVTAFDICPRAVRCSRGNAIDAGVDVDVREGSWTGALTCGPFDVIVSNPPYVPIAPEADSQLIPSSAGPEWSWNGGADGRLILDPLCAAASELLRDGGSMLLVQSAFADADRSLRMLRATGMEAEIIASRWIPFGPVLSAQAKWLENIGRLRTGCRKEKLVVIRADKP
jgi:release factor glutamine methyltransferase